MFQLAFSLAAVLYSANSASFAVVQNGGQSLGYLGIDWIGVIDNGEGDGWPHGPLGNLHVEVFLSNGKRVFHKVIPGPSRNEFLDGDEGFYQPYFLYNWQHTNEQVRVKIWESDPGPFRSHDTVFEAWIHRSGTLTQQTWWYGSAAADAIRNAQRRNPPWLSRVMNAMGMRHYPKTFVRFSTRGVQQATNPPPRPRPGGSNPNRRGTRRVACTHRVPCLHRMPCGHRMPCAHPVQTPYGRAPAHPFDVMHPFDTVHPFDVPHAYDEIPA